MNKLISVTKEVTFDCAHMLSGHEALCKNLHGHTYKVQITVTGKAITEGSSKTMVIDFKHLKQAIENVIVHNFDHAVIFSSKEFRNEAEEELYKWAYNHKLRYAIIPGRTTAEEMAAYFSSEIRNYLVLDLGLINIKSCKCKIYETPTSFAEVEYENSGNF